MLKKTLLILGIIIIVLAGVFVFNKNGESNLVDYEGQQATSESDTPKTEVRVKGMNSEVLIKPSVDNTISGIVTISVTKAPAETKMVFFTIKGGSITEEGPNLGIDSDSSDGWSKMVDTTEYENGLYEIAGLPMESSNENPLGMSSAQIMIEN